MNFLEKLDFLLKEKDINKHQLSKITGIPYTTIDSFYKKGYDNIKLSTLLKLSNYFKCTLDYLVVDDDTEESIKINSSDSENSKTLLELYEAVEDLSENEQLYMLDIIKSLKQRLRKK